MLTASRSTMGTSWMAFSGSPLTRSTLRRIALRARLEWIASEPPRRMTALPAFRHRAAASAVTLGRDS